MPYNYGQPSSSTGAISPELLILFQWPDDEEEASGCTSSAQLAQSKQGLCQSTWPTTIMIMISISIWWLKSKTFRAQHAALKNIQKILV